MPEPYTTSIALYFIFNAIDNDNSALVLFMLLITASQSITLYIRDRLACLFIKTAIISPAVFPCATASWSTLPPCSSATSTGRPAARHRLFTTHRAAACASSISPLAHMISFPCSDPSPRRPLLRTAMFLSASLKRT